MPTNTTEDATIKKSKRWDRADCTSKEGLGFSVFAARTGISLCRG